MRRMLNMPCPNCAKEGNVTDKELWYHGDKCNGYLYIDEYGKISCGKCGTSAYVRDMRVSCRCGKHSKKYINVDDFIYAFGISNEMKSKSDARWFSTMIKNL